MIHWHLELIIIVLENKRLNQLNCSSPVHGDYSINPSNYSHFFLKYRSGVIIWLSFTHIAQFQQKALLVGFMSKNRVWVNFIYLSFNEWSSMSVIDTNERLIKTQFNKWVSSWVQMQISSSEIFNGESAVDINTIQLLQRWGLHME